MKALFVIDTLEVGGAEKSLFDILPRLKAVEPVLCHLYPGSALKPDFVAAGIEVISLNLPGRYSLFSAVQQLRGLIRTHKPALIHSSLVRSSIAARIAGRLEHVPVINSLVSETYAPARRARMGMVRRIKHELMHSCDLITAPLATCFLANSHAIAAASSRTLCIPKRKMEVIYRGRDASRFEPVGPDQTSQAKRELHLPSASLILSVGRLLSSKGQDDLIRAMPQVRAIHPDCHLVLAGDGPHRVALESLIREMGLSSCVHLLGTRSDVPRLMQACEIFVSLSQYEGLPGAVVEAMLSGLPVVLSDMNVHREMVRHEKTGILVPQRDQGALVGALCRLLKSPNDARILGAKGRAHAIDQFSIERVAESHDRLYVAVAGSQAGTSAWT